MALNRFSTGRQILHITSWPVANTAMLIHTIAPETLNNHTNDAVRMTVLQSIGIPRNKFVCIAFLTDFEIGPRSNNSIDLFCHCSQSQRPENLYCQMNDCCDHRNYVGDGTHLDNLFFVGGEPQLMRHSYHTSTAERKNSFPVAALTARCFRTLSGA